MQLPTPTPSLDQRHYVTLIVRMSLDKDGRVIHGELMDMSQSFLRRFSGSAGLNRAVEAWLHRQEQGEGHPQ